ncbi:MAG: Fic family protein [Pseudonocardia sp.]|nr:Fic family protein [Pseudonocardia sp.]
MLFNSPDLTDDELRVLGDLDHFRIRLRHVLHEPRRWKGVLRRNLKARAIQGSNSIEGYDVSLDDALALLDGDEPMDADRRTSLEIVGYRNAMTYIQQLADDPHALLDASLLRSLHFMMLGHDLRNSPGQYRRGPTYVRDDDRAVTVYEGPDADLVPGLMSELTCSLTEPDDAPVFVRAAMAHLNLVMIHPFRDGNGRMARALQTLVLARERVLAPEFSSIEEWLGRNTNRYYDVLADVGAGAWHPERDTREWLRFTLVAHHVQAQTVLRRVEEASRLWQELSEIAESRRLPERTLTALFDAASGLRVRRSGYQRDAEVEPGTAARDLRMMVAAGLLSPSGETRARRYSATPGLKAVRDRVAAGRPTIVDPFGHPPDRRTAARNVTTASE